jgi:hypothetical protein
MSSDTTQSEAEGFLRVRVGTFKRVTSATVGRSRRSIEVENCTVASGSLKDTYKQTITLWIGEAEAETSPWPNDPERIGGFRVQDSIRVILVLPTKAFDQFWAAAAAADGVWRQIQINFRERELESGPFATVLEATLTEFMSGDVAIEFDEKTGSQKAVPPRRDPVSQEIHSLRNSWPSAKGVNAVMNSVIVFIVVVLAISWVIRHLS